LKSALLSVVIAVLVAGVAAVASPLLGLQSLRDALAVRDATGLAPLVDADRLRASVSARVRARYENGGAQLPADPMIVPLVEKLVTPEGLIAAVCDGGAIAADNHRGAPCPVYGSLANIRFESVNRYSAALTEDGRVAATVVMDRAGLRWKLVDLVLPATAYDQLKISALN
jgi:hypothetical protein